MKWKAQYFPIRKLTDEEAKNAIGINLKDWTPGKCAFCQKPKIDNCYNCETPMCKDHANAFVFLMTHNQPLVVFGVCPECVKDNALCRIAPLIKEES